MRKGNLNDLRSSGRWSDSFVPQSHSYLNLCRQIPDSTAHPNRSTRTKVSGTTSTERQSAPVPNFLGWGRFRRLGVQPVWPVDYGIQEPAQAIQTVLILQNSRMPWAESSRPYPERLMPPKGTSG
ncbi:hypothetical protein CCUG63697_01743 [Mycobacteroides franklinii]|uniref:Uncharacterized protein n=1 Tax=Mycobacteroides franklinii TaxID=948102 RepID=A0A4R8R4V8_9MYCO|nr:hypothetical protein CCUG63697_01743 [Mycobacteroides franklinii]